MINIINTISIHYTMNTNSIKKNIMTLSIMNDYITALKGRVLNPRYNNNWLNVLK